MVVVVLAVVAYLDGYHIQFAPNSRVIWELIQKGCLESQRQWYLAFAEYVSLKVDA